MAIGHSLVEAAIAATQAHKALTAAAKEASSQLATDRAAATDKTPNSPGAPTSGAVPGGGL